MWGNVGSTEEFSVNTLSVLIATKDRPVDLQACLQSLLAQMPQPDEIVIIDQSRVPGKAQILSLLQGSAVRFCYAYEPTLSGLTQARNRAVALATGTVLLFLDDDVELAPGYVAEILAAFDEGRSGRLGGIGGLIVNLPETLSGLQRARVKIFFRGPFSVERDALAFHLRPGDRPRRARRLHGCNMAYRREVLERLAFDESYGGYGFGEDRDFSAEVARLYELWWRPRARLIHKQTPVSRLDRARFCEFRVLSWFRFYERCAPKTLGVLLSYLWLNVGFMSLLFKVWDMETVRGTGRGLWRLLAIATGRADLTKVLREGWHVESG